MKIQVFGPGCPKCNEVELNVKEAIKESGLPADVEKVSDFKEMMTFGVMSTPAIAINGKIMCTGSVPSKKEIKEWLAVK